jgi:hypothetical protein
MAEFTGIGSGLFPDVHGADVEIGVEIDWRELQESFVLDIIAAAEKTLAELAEKGAARSRELAPVGKKPDKRTPALKDSITSHSDHEKAEWSCTARHALITEEGGGPSEITGRVSFFWEAEGRPWRPGDNKIRHPSTGAQPYLAPALFEIMDKWDEVAKRYYPN